MTASASRDKTRVHSLLRGNRLVVVGVCAIVLMTAAVYIPAMQGGFIWDDDANVTEDTTLRSLHGLYRIWFDPYANQQYYPLMRTSLWLNYQLWDLNPFSYHLVNVLLHALVAVLLWFVLMRLRVPGAWFAAAVFALHPINTESVAWITERKNVLSGVFFMASVLAYIRFAGLHLSHEEQETWRPRGRSYALVVVLVLCALLSKTATAVLPAVFLVLLWWKRPRVTRRDVFLLVPMFALAATSGLGTAWLERYHCGAEGAEWGLSLPGKLLVAGRALWFYAGKLLWPASLIFIYPRWDIDTAEAGQYLYPLAAVAVIVALWALRQRIGRAPLAAVLYYVVALAPALGFFNVYFMRYSYVQDHFQYFAGAGFIALVTAVLYGASVKLAASVSRLGFARYPFSAAVLVALGALTWRQGYIYKDSETLWRDTLAKNPAAWMAHVNLGNIHKQQGRLDEAIRRYERALRINPREPEIYYNIGTVRALQHKYDEAMRFYRRAIRLDPNHADAHCNLAILLSVRGMFDEAVREYETTLKIRPNHAKAHYNLAGILSQQGLIEESIEHYREALRINPEFVEAHFSLGVVLIGMGEFEEAVEHLSEVVRLRPELSEGHYELGLALSRTDRLEEAVVQYREAIRLRPDYAEAHHNLAAALYLSGRYPEAWEELRLAQRYGLTPSPELVKALSAAMRGVR